MTAVTKRHSAMGAALAVCLAFASTAQAGPYPSNVCVSKKQALLGKYAGSVGKAWVKYPSDMVSREAAIDKALEKLEKTWTKSEASAAKKEASCSESTSTAAQAAAIVDAAIDAIHLENFSAVTGYIGDVMKARGKYIKDPLKDPGKVKLTAAIGTASTENLAGANMTVLTAASDLESDLVDATTRAPNYPDTFQTIEPNVCASGTCGGTDTVCATNTDCATQKYGKVELTPQCVDGDPYMYFAKRGTSNNVLMYYQGGGACWSKASCFSIPGGTCSRTADAADNPALTTTGFADYNDPSNPFHDWNVVFVTYCSCDVHWGDARVAYDVGQIAQHRGRVNAALVEKFAREHFVDPDRVFVTGSSAGSYGAIMNSYFLMKNVWPNADYSILGDAGVGIITQQFLNDFITNWNIAANFPEDLPGVTLPITNLSLVDLIDGLAQAYPNARLANYDSSYDGGSGSQTQFFQVMRHPVPGGGDILLDWGRYWEATCEWNACMRDFKQTNFTRADGPGRTKNYKYFTGAGSRHTIFGSDKVYTETKSTTAGGTGVTFAAWVQAMIDDTPAWENVDCNNPGGDCDLTNSCQGGSNAGGACSPKCSGGINAGNVCDNNIDCAFCSGGDNDGLPCTSNASCDVPDPGIDGVCAGSCSAGASTDCPGGSCQLDPDTDNAPYANNDTVSCAPTTCPCVGSGKCFDGVNEGDSCTTNADCVDAVCSWVRCPTP